MSKKDKEFINLLKDEMKRSDFTEILGISRQALSRGVHGEKDYFTKEKLERIANKLAEDGKNVEFFKEIVSQIFGFLPQLYVEISFAVSHSCRVIIVGDKTDQPVAYLQLIEVSEKPIALPLEILEKIQQSLKK